MLEAQGSQNKSHSHTATSTVSDTGHTHSYSSANHPTASGPEQNQGGGAEDRTTFNVGKTTGSSSTGISVSTSIDNTGGTEARPRSIAMMYIIKF